MENITSQNQELFQVNDTKSYEPLLDQKNERFVLFPIGHQDIWEDYYQKALRCFWTAGEINLTSDINDWQKGFK